MEQDIGFESLNINSKWLDNIYDNLKNLENLERIARSGAASLIEYCQIPMQDRPFVGDIMYKNLQFMANELDLLLTDLAPVVPKEDIKIFRDKLNPIKQILLKKDFFITESIGLNGSTKTGITLKPYFYDTLEALADIKRDIIIHNDISAMLYVKKKDPFKKW